MALNAAALICARRKVWRPSSMYGILVGRSVGRLVGRSVGHLMHFGDADAWLGFSQKHSQVSGRFSFIQQLLA